MIEVVARSVAAAGKRKAVAQKPASAHKRNTGPMLTSPRCGARTRSGIGCRSPAVAGKERCRMHGGAQGSGAPPGNYNAFKHGEYSREAVEMRRQVSALVRQVRQMLLETAGDGLRLVTGAIERPRGNAAKG